MADIPEAAYVAVARAFAADTPDSKHGQFCPIWTERAKKPASARCDCWILRNARHDAAVAVDAVWALAVAEGRRAQKGAEGTSTVP